MNTPATTQLYQTPSLPETDSRSGRLPSGGGKSKFPAATRWALISACLAAALVLMPANSYAAKRFAVISVSNETKANLTISYRWGSGEWKQHFLAPGARHWFAWKYANSNEPKSPDMFIRFDSDSGPSKYTEDKKLHGYAVAEESYDVGHKYAFRYDGPSKKYIEIWDVSGPGVSPHPGASPSVPRGRRID